MTGQVAMMLGNGLFTIGHSNLDLAVFIDALRQNRVALLVDVRSRPHSSRFPQFSQPDFEFSLRSEEIRYLFLGEELGGRPEDPKAYRADGRVDYRVVRESHAFRGGLERVAQELGKQSLALMCAEEDPLTCHRFLMICPELIPAGILPQHIRKGGVLESQQEAEDRLLAEQGLSFVAGASLFPADRSACLEDAYLAQAEKCAFRADPQTVDRW